MQALQKKADQGKTDTSKGKRKGTGSPVQGEAVELQPVGASHLAGMAMQRKCACGNASSLGESMAYKGKRLQTKLSIGASNDPLEQEADRVADQVMAAPAHTSITKAKPRIQRYTAQATANAGTAPASVDRVLASTGNPLAPALQQNMSQRFGYDFSQVRVHTGAAADQSAIEVNALAYTVGKNVVFGSGQFAPGSHEGRRLLAHELTHVMQQGGLTSAQPIVRRALTPDFQITGISPEDAADPGMIFFGSGVSTIPASERPKIAALALPKNRNLTLNGFSDEVGSAALNDTIISARLQAVNKALVAAGHTGARARVNLRASGIGQINYRHMRSVEVIPTPGMLAFAPSAQPTCSVPGSEIAPCGTAFTNSWPDANAAMSKAKAELAGAGTLAAQALLGTLFSAVPKATVQSNISKLATQVQGLPGNEVCHTSCDAGCGRPAFNTGTGIGLGGAKMTLCPDFLSSGDKAWQARTLIHESAHGTPGLAAKDIAYGSTRQINFLTAADQLRNTDSYVLLVWLLFRPGSINIGPAIPDTILAMNPGEIAATRRAVAWVESWLNYGDFDTGILYETVNRSVPPALAWDTSKLGDTFNIETMHRIAPIFGLTDPGAAMPFTLPSAEDKSKIAGIHDRYDQMYKAVNWQVLTINKGPPGSDGWGGRGASLPRLTQTATVGPSFFGLPAIDQVKHFIKLMATAISGISAGFRQKFVDAIDAIRNHRTLGP